MKAIVFRSITVVLIFVSLQISSASGIDSDQYVDAPFALNASKMPSMNLNNSQSIANVLDSLTDIENLQINIFPGGAVLKGELLTAQDMRRVRLVAEKFSNIVNLCSLHREALEVSAVFINRQMKAMGIDDLSMRVVGTSLFLSGRPSSKDDVKRVQKICEALGLTFIDGTNDSITNPRMVVFEIAFTEVNKQAFTDFGISWPSSVSLSDPGGFRMGRLSPEKSLELTISIAAQNGKARIISRPRLVCRFGERATFLAGGEIAIPKKDKDGQLSVSWKRYGIILEIEPQLGNDGLIYTRIVSEVSTIDYANSIDGIPGILTRRVETFLSLSPGQTAVLSGLINSEDAHNISKIPLLGDIPIIGELFKSHSFRKRETELLVFLTPQIADSTSLSSEQPEKWDAKQDETARRAGTL